MTALDGGLALLRGAKRCSHGIAGSNASRTRRPARDGDGEHALPCMVAMELIPPVVDASASLRVTKSVRLAAGARIVILRAVAADPRQRAGGRLGEVRVGAGRIAHGAAASGDLVDLPVAEQAQSQDPPRVAARRGFATAQRRRRAPRHSCATRRRRENPLRAGERSRRMRLFTGGGFRMARARHACAARSAQRRRARARRVSCAQSQDPRSELAARNDPRLHWRARAHTTHATRDSARVFGRQRLRVEAQVILDEGRDEVIAVVVARMPAQRQRLAGLAAGGFEARRYSAARRGTDPPVPGRPASPARAAPTRDQLARVVLLPRFAVVAQIARERLHAPRALRTARRSARTPTRCDTSPGLRSASINAP